MYHGRGRRNKTTVTIDPFNTIKTTEHAR
jgi:hypothetical protein